MRRSITLLLAVLTACPAASALAQTIVSPRELAHATIDDLLNVTITTATLTSEGAQNAPARVDVVTDAQIQRRGYRSLADVLKDLPDFKVDLGGDADYPAQLTVDGVRGADRVVVLLDGIRISSPTNEPLPILANYPVHAARQVEIVYGPASALYGADAFSAVINIISRTVDEAPGLSFGTSVGQFGLYNETGSYGVRLGQSASLMVNGQAQFDRQPDLSRYYADYQGMAAQRAGVFNTIFGPMTPASAVSPDYHIPIATHSLQATFRAGGVQAMLFENRSRVPTTPAYTPDNGAYDANAFNLNKLLVASIGMTRAIGRVNSVSTATFSRQELDPRSGYQNVYSNFERSYKYAYGSILDLDEQLTWKPAQRATITAGGTFEHFYSIPQGADLNAPLASTERPGTILGTTIPDAMVKVRYNNTGGFAQAQVELPRSLTVTLGGRADYNTRFGWTFNPRAGVVARPAPGTTFKLLYGTAYLAPSPYQEYGHYGSFYSTDGGQTYASSYWHVPNPGLKPQLKKTVELNVLQTLGTALHLSASAFYSSFSDTIKEADADRAYSGQYLGWPVDYIDFAVNEGHSESYGGSFGINFMRSLGGDRRVEARAALVMVDGRVWEDDAGESNTSLPLGAMVPVQARFTADLDWHRWSVAPRLAVVGTQRLVATVDGSSARRTLPGYAVLDVNVRRRDVLKHVDAFVTIENALDARYRAINARAYLNPEELVGAPQNPRRFTVGFDFRLK